MWVPPAPLDNMNNVCSAQAASFGKESACTVVPVFHLSAEDLELCRPHDCLAGACPLRSTAAEDISN